MNDCMSWASLADKAAIGESLTPEERLHLRSHPGACPDCAAEARLWQSLELALEEPERLTAWPSKELVAQGAGRKPRRWRQWVTSSRPRLIGASALLAAAASAAIWGPLKGENASSASGVPESVRVARVTGEPRPATARMALTSGRVLVNGRVASAGQSLGTGSAISVEEGRACVLAPPGVTACLEAGTLLTVEALEAERRRFRLHQGHVVAHLERQPVGSTFGFETAAGPVVARGTVFSLRTAGAAVTLRVHEGVVTNGQGARQTPFAAPRAALLVPGAAPSLPDESADLADSALIDLAKLFTDAAQSPLTVMAAVGSSVALGAVQLGPAPTSALLAAGQYRMEVARPGHASIVEQLQVDAGASLSRSYEATPPLTDVGPRTDGKRARASSSAAQLLQQARGLRGEGRYRDAQAMYHRLLREHEGSAEARVALVSLGDLQLSQLGNAGAALRAFDGYLKGGGALSQEASYGRIRALRALGRTSDARAAADTFLRAYPKSVQAAALRKELP